MFYWLRDTFWLNVSEEPQRIAHISLISIIIPSNRIHYRFYALCIFGAEKLSGDDGEDETEPRIRSFYVYGLAGKPLKVLLTLK